MNARNWFTLAAFVAVVGLLGVTVWDSHRARLARDEAARAAVRWENLWEERTAACAADLRAQKEACRAARADLNRGHVTTTDRLETALAACRAEGARVRAQVTRVRAQVTRLEAERAHLRRCYAFYQQDRQRCMRELSGPPDDRQVVYPHHPVMLPGTRLCPAASAREEP